MATTVNRTFDLLKRLEKNFPNKKDILSVRRREGWIEYSTQDYINNAHYIAYALLSMGYNKEDKAITITNNRPEWNFIDIGLNLAGMVHVPVYPTLGHDDYLHIIKHSDAKIVFIGTPALYKKVAPIVAEIENAPKIVMIDNSKELECIDNFYKIGKSKEKEFKEVVEYIKKETDPHSIATIIYTSGTTGIPKGVMLSHNNLMFNAIGHALKQTVNSSQRMVSFLPLCHIYERTMNYEYQYLGISTYYAEGLGTISRDLSECHAHGFCAVPRVLEMMYGKLQAAGNALPPIQKAIYNWAWEFGNNFDNYNTSILYKLQHSLADKLIYSKWRAKLGGNEMLVVSGGSAIQAKIVRLFNAAKLRIFEGYGLTETSPVIAVNSPVQGYNIIGTVGKPMEGTEFKFAEDGEILTKGPHVMLGYYKDPETTKEVIDEDGWFHTGDIGRWEQGEYVKITDRKKEIFKLSSGKYIAPQVIETLLKESPYIENCMVVGINEKFASAIIVPDFEKLHFWAAKYNITFTNNESLIQEPKIIAKIHKEVDKVNQTVAPYEQVKREKIVLGEWSANTGMLGQTLKLKRANVYKKYDEAIKSIYTVGNLPPKVN